jgi:acetolactate synthase-1/2/3 large subunit
MRLADLIFKVVRQYVDTVFFMPGGGAAYLVDALGQSGLKAVSMMHEQGAGYAALGYAMHHGLGVCLTTSGPGATNAVTPCAAGWAESVPVLFISGQCRSDTMLTEGMRTRGSQEIDIYSIVKPITKKIISCTHNAFALTELRMMGGVQALVEEAQRRRPGPVWLDVPLDKQGEEV